MNTAVLGHETKASFTRISWAVVASLLVTSPAGGGEPTLAATLTGSAESVAWSGDGNRLLVLAADPGSYGLDWGARAVRGAEPDSDPVVRRPGDARRATP